MISEVRSRSARTITEASVPPSGKSRYFETRPLMRLQSCGSGERTSNCSSEARNRASARAPKRRPIKCVTSATTSPGMTRRMSGVSRTSRQRRWSRSSRSAAAYNAPESTTATCCASSPFSRPPGHGLGCPFLAEDVVNLLRCVVVPATTQGGEAESFPAGRSPGEVLRQRLTDNRRRGLISSAALVFELVGQVVLKQNGSPAHICILAYACALGSRR